MNNKFVMFCLAVCNFVVVSTMDKPIGSNQSELGQDQAILRTTVSSLSNDQSSVTSQKKRGITEISWADKRFKAQLRHEKEMLKPQSKKEEFMQAEMKRLLAGSLACLGVSGGKICYKNSCGKIEYSDMNKSYRNHILEMALQDFRSK
jgi:hypothetical protein